MKAFSCFALLSLVAGCEHVEIQPDGAAVAVANVLLGAADNYSDEGHFPKVHRPFLRIWRFRISSGGKIKMDDAPDVVLNDDARDRVGSDWRPVYGSEESRMPRLKLRLDRKEIYFQITIRF